MTVNGKLPPGPRAPNAVQTMGWWSRPHAYMERLRARGHECAPPFLKAV